MICYVYVIICALYDNTYGTVMTLNFHIPRVATNVSCSSIMHKYNSYMNIIYNVNFKKNV